MGSSMIEAEWLECNSVHLMLSWLNGRVSERKLRLFAAACCRRIWDLIPNDPGRKSVEYAELVADGAGDSARARQLSSYAEYAAFHAIDQPKLYQDNALRSALLAAGNTLSDYLRSPQDCGAAVANKVVAGMSSSESAWESIFAREAKHQACLLREIIGNPFCSYDMPKNLSPTVVQIASTHYDHGNCAFALRDSLLDIGSIEFAEHFTTKDDWHPKGCWVIDVILGKS